MKDLKTLSKDTANVLLSLSEIPFMQNFVLVGGSGLALYLNHRLSEDLDFFSNQEFSKDKIFNQLSRFKDVKTTLITENQIDLIINKVKVTFCYQNNDLLENKQNLIKNIFIANLDSIISMKILTIFLRAKFRDYFDLYCIAKNLGIEKLFEIGQNNIPAYSQKLFEKSLIFTNDIDFENINYLNPKELVDIHTIEKYFIAQIKNWNKVNK